MKYTCYISGNQTTLFHLVLGKPQELERYLLMGCYGSLAGVHSQVLHFYVLVFPINIQKCLVITRLGFIYMQSAGVAINAVEKFS